MLPIEQVVIMFTGATAIWLSQDRRESWRKWSSVLGLIGQPFWFIAVYKAQQWGILFMCCLYTYSWARGFYNYWIRP